MVNFSRKLGVNIYECMSQKGVSPEEFAEKLCYSVKDVWNIIEGKVVIPPIVMDRIVDALGMTKKELFDYKTDTMLPDLQYMKEFDNPENLDRVLDLIDEYVELKESI